MHPDELIRYGLTLNDVLTAARRSPGVRGAGFVDTRNQRIVFQTEGQSLRPDAIARTVLFSRGAASVTLGNVADVVDAPEPPIGGAAVQGSRGVILNLAEQYAADTLQVTENVEAALEELQRSCGRVLRRMASRSTPISSVPPISSTPQPEMSGIRWSWVAFL